MIQVILLQVNHSSIDKIKHQKVYDFHQISTLPKKNIETVPVDSQVFVQIESLILRIVPTKRFETCWK